MSRRGSEGGRALRLASPGRARRRQRERRFSPEASEARTPRQYVDAEAVQASHGRPSKALATQHPVVSGVGVKRAPGPVPAGTGGRPSLARSGDVMMVGNLAPWMRSRPRSEVLMPP